MPPYLREREWDDQLRQELDKWHDGLIRQLGERECPECTAEQSLESTRALLSSLASWLRMPPLPLMQGSVRSLAFAESLRVNAIRVRFELAHEATDTALYGPDATGSLLALEGFRSRWPQDKWAPFAGEPASPAASSLQEGLRELRSDFLLSISGFSFEWYEHSGPAASMMFWLLCRDMWPTTGDVLLSKTPEQWIADKRSRRGTRSQVDLSSGHFRLSPFIALLISHLAHWGNPFEAGEAARALSTHALPMLAGEESRSIPPNMTLAAFLHTFPTLAALS